jgi:4-hydroxybenzoate polyprenyltransferase
LGIVIVNPIKILAVLRLLRPEHWTKNLFVFLPAFLGGQLLDVPVLLSCAVAFAAFSLSASSVYCFNDIYDVEADKSHPEKRKRPLAAGVISRKTAYAAMTACFLLSMLTIFLFGGNLKYAVMAFILSYYILNIAYCVKLKRYAIIDVVIVAIGFVLRVWVGGLHLAVKPSEWTVIMTFLLALFLAFAKRRDDVILYQNTGVAHRENTVRYNPEFMNQIITVIAAITIVAYIMCTLSPEVIERFNSRNGRYIYFTSVFVLMGIIRYLQVTIVDLKSGSPTKILLRDRFIQCCIIGWIGLFIIIVYSRKVIYR